MNDDRMIGQSAQDQPARARPPFGFLRPAVGVAGLYALAALVWVAVGDGLPGGRWFAVHLFTLGVVTNLVMALTHHFAQTLLHAPGGNLRAWRLALTNVGVLAMLVAWPGQPWLLATGATVVTACVAWLYVDLRRMRKGSLTGRFAFVVRGYERACGAFFHGAALGVLLGIGVLGGEWYGAVRVAHLHVNILGWGGLTLLATVVFFGPTMLRTRMIDGTDRNAVKALRHAATGLSVATGALILTGLGGPAGIGARLLAGAGLAVYAAGATVICLSVLRAGRAGHASPHGWMIQAACTWFTVVVWADVAVVASGQLWLLDALGAALLVGVLGQAILASLNYLAPMVWSVGPAARAAARDRLAKAPVLRPTVLNAGVLLIIAAAAAGPHSRAIAGPLAVAGWAAVGLAVLAQLGLLGREAGSALRAR